MYLIGRITDENLDSLKVGDEIQIVSYTGLAQEPSGFVLAPDIPSHFSVFSQFPYRGSRNLDQVPFRVISSRTKRTFTWDVPSWRSGLSVTTMKYHDFRYYRSHYFILKKMSIVDLDCDDDDCI